MYQGMEVNIKGIKCDNVNCDYIDKNVPVEDYHLWLNKRCPKCGSILLTQQDYDNIQLMLDFAKQFGPLMAQDNDSLAKVTVQMNGAGEMDFRLEIEDKK